MRASQLIFASGLGRLVEALSCSNSTFTAVLPSNATLNYATPVAAGGTFGGESFNIAFPKPATGLPALCAVSINVKSSESSSFNFGVFLPNDWNERFIATGNGGFGGGINWPDMGQLTHYGFASLSTDTGHISTAQDGSWALNKPESVIDWGYRAMHGSVELGKLVTTAYYGSNESIKYSYYSGCSTGGRQGLKQAQMYPGDFDGVVAGAPAWWTTHLQTWTLHYGLQNLASSGERYIPRNLLQGARDEAVRQCDAQDGVVDGIISDPKGCNFRAETLLCRPGYNSSTSTCLTAPQLETLYRLSTDWIDTNQTFVFPSPSLGADQSALAGGSINPLGTGYVTNFLLNTTEYDTSSFDYSVVQQADTINSGDANADHFDMSDFHSRSGKLIMYHGLADPLIPAGSSEYFYNQVFKAMTPQGSELGDFYRFYQVPGMGHCSSSQVAPWYIGAAGQMINGTDHSVPGFADSRHDVILAITDWVENGQAPESIVATKFQNDDARQGVLRQRPLCPYPQQARYDGKGDVDNAESWSCQYLGHRSPK